MPSAPRTFTWQTTTRHFSLTHSPICTSLWRRRRWKACPTLPSLELDTDALEIRLPEDKRERLHRLVTNTVISARFFKCELASLLGYLSFAARAVPAGRTFLRCLYNLDRATALIVPYENIRLSSTAVQDLEWWANMLGDWSGKSFFVLEKWKPAPDLKLQTHASGAYDYGTYFDGRWLHGQWKPSQQNYDITYKELFAIVVVCATWGQQGSLQRIEFQCNNQAAVICIKAGTCRSPQVMHLIRSLYWLCARSSNFFVRATHIAETSNIIADAMSRGVLQEFRRRAPIAAKVPDSPVVPTEI